MKGANQRAHAKRQAMPSMPGMPIRAAYNSGVRNMNRSSVNRECKKRTKKKKKTELETFSGVDSRGRGRRKPIWNGVRQATSLVVAVGGVCAAGVG
eukprot:NODE_5007_length_538_cov_51.065440_g3680_i0.p2 GENE.NODE_5007_length_538_cov_51.065440_g3680_i0~~NODE_5007_length_538_cov_51.065440_g3680_i0.p2  ORF type:complete len:96 (-),score=16.14 NODE_5007_length_538_cov_51.065440_g3680_i0:115-402(-)